MKKHTTLLVLILATAGFSQSYHYGGDFDGRDAWVAQTGPIDGRVYDDFNVASQITVSGLFGNYLDFGAVYSSASWEIRTGIVQGNPGTLVASGSALTTTIATGRSGFGALEYQVSISGLNVVLNPGTYFMSLSIDDTTSSQSIYLCTTSGTDIPTVGDPNPVVAGGPVANGNSFYNSSFFGHNWINITEAMGGTANYDFSYGVNVVPEPSGIAVVAVALGGLLVSRRKKR
jgi:hypothetical protein